MTYRFRLFLGLVAALPSAALPSARGSEGATQAASSAAPAAAIAEDPSAWKRSDRPSSVDIRFKKPDSIVFTDQPEQPTQNATSVALASKLSAAPLAATAPAAPASNQPSAATIAPAPAASAPVAAIAMAPIQAATAPATVVPAIQQQPVAAGASAPYADDQVRLVAQLLMDRGVIRAAQEEPLPAAPNTATPNGRNNRGMNGNHNNDPIGPAPDSGPIPVGDEGCYDDCNCCPPPPCLFWVGGVEATFLVPDLNSNPSTFAVEEIAKDRIDFCSTESTDVNSMYLSPRIWIGVQGCCWGANLRYWHLQAGEGEYDPSIGGLGTWDDYDCGRPDLGFFSNTRLEAYTVDLELTRRFCINDCWMQAALGVRHAEIENSDSITGLALTDEGILNGFAHSERQSRGTGLLLGLYGRKALFPCSCVNWFYNARLSTLWGPTSTAAETFAAVQSSDPDFVASAGSVNGAYTTIDDTLVIGEIQLGLEWNYALCCLPANAFFRMALEYQRWDGGKGESAADSFAGISIDDGEPATSIVSTSAFAQEPQMDLLGFTIGTGLTW